MPEKQRIEYIDALRGFTMILVVIHHVALFMWGILGTYSIHSYLMQVRMPMFYFISGFVLYKAGVVWNLKHAVQFLRKKFVVQIVSTIIFFTLFVHVMDIDFVPALFSHMKAGYWFTYILFQYFIFYALAQLLFRKYAYLVMLLMGIAFLPIYYTPITNAIPLPESVKGLLSIVYWRYFLFFVLGSLVHKYFTRVEQWLDGRWLLLICLVTYFVLNIYRDVFPSNAENPLCGFLIGLILTFTGLTILFGFFRANQEHFTNDKVLGRSLQYIGRRTLDIYLIHYFLLPFREGGVVHIFTDHHMPVIEAFCSLMVTLLIIAFSLLISSILRLSPILAHYLFGAKLQQDC